jgi:hypothetical protein
MYRATPAGEQAHEAWLREPVNPATIAPDLGLHLMRFVMAEKVLPREDVLRFLTDLADALDQFIEGIERFVKTAGLESRHGLLALQHGIDVHRASLTWARGAIAALTEPDSPASPDGHAGSTPARPPSSPDP